MAVWRTVRYYEATPASPNESWAVDASKVMRTLLFFGDGPRATTGPDARERQLIAEEFLGYGRVTTEAGKTYLERQTPHYYPAANDSTYLYATSFVSSELVGKPIAPGAVKGAAIGDQLAKSPCWRVQAQYSTLPYDVRSDSDVRATAGVLNGLPDEGDCLRRGWANTRYITKQFDPGGRVIPIMAGVLFYEGTEVSPGHASPSQEPFPFNETVGYVTYTWHAVPLAAVPFVGITSQLNTVNDATFDGFAKGTLLFISPKMTPRRDPFGNRTMDMQYRMMWCPRQNSVGDPLGHNATLRIRNGFPPTWTLMTTSKNGASADANRPYRYTDFGSLFRPDQP